MNYHRFKQRILVPLLMLPMVFGFSAASAQDSVLDTSIIDRANEAAGQAIAAAAQAQIRINQLSDEADVLVQEYREVAKVVDGLEVYNAGFRRTIAEQERTIAEYEESIEGAAALQRQVPPLMERMMVAIEQFVDLDLPFLLDTRKARLELIRGTFDDSSVNVAEKFRLVLAAYQQEINYGRVMEHYTDTLEIGGIDRDVDILRVGRVALLYQTSDQTETGVWDKTSNQWVTLEDDFRRPVANGIRMAKQEATIEILELPIAAPE